MTSDHHGREAERATLLVRAVDKILGTHRVKEALRAPGSPALRSLAKRIGLRPS
jgi:hypothetical protein